jgi:hypothetical protein
MKFFKILMVMGVLAFGASANATTALPDLNIDFAGIYGGSLEGVTGGDATGTNISITALSISGASFNDGAVAEYEITNGTLNFDTAQNTFVIEGEVADLNVSGVLFDGGMTGWSYTTGFFDVFQTDGSGAMGDSLLAAIEEPNSNPFAFVAFSLESRDGTLNSTDVLSTSIAPRTPEVPIPAAAWLFASGLIGLVGVGRRKV